ncbi:MAG: DeoR/GlpR transcriptional regulator [Roseiflexaceae bacterium]|nr:DeoR/GlpR transcriptional regulator [Roseiflexaceae bacterium]
MDDTHRAEHILQLLVRQGRVAVEELSRELGVNGSTIRRDLEKLERQNLLRRVHGGAVAADALSYTAYAHELSFQANLNKQAGAKTQIALAAMQLIQPADTIAISPGTTTTQLARALRHSPPRPLTVVTTAVNVAMELAGVRELNLVLSGGFLLPDFFALAGPLAEQSLRELYVSTAFIGVTGLSTEHGLTGPNQLEALTYRATIERARRVVVLADSTKLGTVALFRIAPLPAVHTLITDATATEAQLAPLRAAGLEIIVAAEF